MGLCDVYLKMQLDKGSTQWKSSKINIFGCFRWWKLLLVYGSLTGDEVSSAVLALDTDWTEDTCLDINKRCLKDDFARIRKEFIQIKDSGLCLSSSWVQESSQFYFLVARALKEWARSWVERTVLPDS